VFIPCRVDKLLRDCTTSSVAELRRALDQRRVTLRSRGETRSAEGHELVFEHDQVALDGRTMTPKLWHDHAILNKPASVTSTVRDPEGRADLRQFLQQMPRGLFPIGRLDRETTGLLVFTSDGDLAQAVLHPDHHTEKLYWLWLDEHVADHDRRLVALTEGVAIRGGTARAERVSILQRTADCTELLVTLNEGKNRQIRRMCRALNFRLRALHRRAVGPIELGTLSIGAWRPLQPAEAEALWDATGGRHRVQQRKIAALVAHAGRVRAAQEPDRRLEAWLEASSIAPPSVSA
jgi:23S rRNA pseudouridine2605 synthase